MTIECGKIRLIILDVDGVLTDGRVYLDARGAEIKAFHVRDGQGIRLWLDAGHEIGIITGRKSEALAYRAKELGIGHVYQGSRDKLEDYRHLLRKVNLTGDEVAMVGDDLPDLPIMRHVGFPVAVGDAVSEVKEEAKYITDKPGGCGAVREVIELVMRERGEWDQVVERIRGR